MPVFTWPFSVVMKCIGKQDGNPTMAPRIGPLFVIKREYGQMVHLLNEHADLNAIFLLRSGQGLWRTGADYDAGKAENALTGQISWVEFPSEIGVPSEYKKLRFWRNTSIPDLPTGQTAFLGRSYARV